LGRFRPRWGWSWPLLGRSWLVWAALGSLWVAVGWSWPLVGRSWLVWAALGSLWVAVGSSRVRFGGVKGQPGSGLGRSWGGFGHYRGALGHSWRDYRVSRSVLQWFSLQTLNFVITSKNAMKNNDFHGSWLLRGRSWGLLDRFERSCAVSGISK